jgi:FkbM family methyltransferase
MDAPPGLASSRAGARRSSRFRSQCNLGKETVDTLTQGRVKAATATALGCAVRAYLRHVPWRTGKTGLYRLYYRRFGWRPHRAVVQTRFGDLMDLTVPDSVSSAIYLTGRWEPVITQYLRSRLRTGDTFVDCGANIGYYSLIASRLVGNSGQVFSIEASAQIYLSLLRNVTLNDCANVRCIHAAAAGEPGELSIYLADSHNLGHSTTVQSLAAREGMTLEGMVEADTLEHLVGSPNLRNARFIKIDVEGAELSVLQPLFGSLDQFSAHTEWLVELAPSFSAGGYAETEQIYRAFSDAGYIAYRIPNDSDAGFLLDPPGQADLQRLDAAPQARSDVLMSRQHLEAQASSRGSFAPYQH